MRKFNAVKGKKQGVVCPIKSQSGPKGEQAFVKVDVGDKLKSPDPL